MNITDAQRSDQLRGDARNEQSEKSGGFTTSALAAAAVCAAVSEQVLALLEEWLGPYLGKEDGTILTKTMINNYVKLHFIQPPVRRKYDRLTLASLFVIAVLKPVYTIEEIGYLIRLSLGHSDPQAAYDDFCDCAEAAVSHAFHQTTMERNTKAGDPRLLLWNACNAFACQLYVRRIYLEDAMARPTAE